MKCPYDQQECGIGEGPACGDCWRCPTSPPPITPEMSRDAAEARNEPPPPDARGEGTKGNDGLLWPQTFDAQAWARVFIRCFRAKPEIATDEGEMIGWFANAIMRGYDKAKEVKIAVDSPVPDTRGEPAIPHLRTECQRVNKTEMYSGFTMLEDACIRLRETDKSLPDWLNALIKRAQIREAMLRAPITISDAQRTLEASQIIDGLWIHALEELIKQRWCYAAALVERCGKEE